MESIRSFDVETPMLVVNDSHGPYATDVCKEFSKATAIELPFDSGISVKRNVGGHVAIDSEYLLFADDDTTFTHLDIPAMEEDLGGDDCEYLCSADMGPVRTVDIETGKVTEKPFAQSSGGKDLYHGGPNIIFCHRDTFLKNQWDPRLKIGEHAPFVYRNAEEGIGIARTEHMTGKNESTLATSQDYKRMRARSHQFTAEWAKKHTPYTHLGIFGHIWEAGLR